VDRPAIEAAQADLRPLKVLEDADVNAQFVGHLADGGDPGGVVGVVAVGEVQPEGGGARLDQAAQHLGRFGGGADRGDDLRATHEIDNGHRSVEHWAGNYHPEPSLTGFPWT
jgi:hypothetical protein